MAWSSFSLRGCAQPLPGRCRANDFFPKAVHSPVIVRSFQGHLDRLFALEEYDGYMDLVNKRAPRLSKIVDALKLEHEEFRGGVRRIALGLERISSPTDQAKFDTVCGELLDLLDKLEVHGRKETDLFQEAFEQDRGGGEG